MNLNKSGYVFSIKKTIPFSVVEQGNSLFQIPVVDLNSCKRSYRHFMLTSNMFCAGWPNGKADTCAGDSGGGLMCRANPKKKRSRYQIQGITSFGDGCGRRNKYGIYTVVYNYRVWIRYNIEHYS